MGLPRKEIKMGNLFNGQDGKGACCIERKEVDGELVKFGQGLGNCHCGCCPIVPDGNLKFTMINCRVLNPRHVSPKYDDWTWPDDIIPPPVGQKPEWPRPPQADYSFDIDKWEDCKCTSEMEITLEPDKGVQCNHTSKLPIEGGGFMTFNLVGQGPGEWTPYAGLEQIENGAPPGGKGFPGGIEFGGHFDFGWNVDKTIPGNSQIGSSAYSCIGGEYKNSVLDSVRSFPMNQYYSDNATYPYGNWHQTNKFTGDDSYKEAWGAEINNWCAGCIDTDGGDVKKTVATNYAEEQENGGWTATVAGQNLVYDKAPGTCGGMSIRASLCCCKTGIPQMDIALGNQYQPQYDDEFKDNNKGNHPCLISDNTFRGCSDCFFRSSPPLTTWRELYMITADLKEGTKEVDGVEVPNGELEPDTKQKDYYNGGQKHNLEITYSIIEGRAKGQEGVEAGTLLGNICGLHGNHEAMNSSDDEVYLGQKLNPEQCKDSQVGGCDELKFEDFKVDIDAAFAIWAKTFNWLYPWLNLTFTYVGKETGRKHISVDHTPYLLKEDDNLNKLKAEEAAARTAYNNALATFNATKATYDACDNDINCQGNQWPDLSTQLGRDQKAKWEAWRALQLQYAQDKSAMTNAATALENAMASVASAGSTIGDIRIGMGSFNCGEHGAGMAYLPDSWNGYGQMAYNQNEDDRLRALIGPLQEQVQELINDHCPPANQNIINNIQAKLDQIAERRVAKEAEMAPIEAKMQACGDTNLSGALDEHEEYPEGGEHTLEECNENLEGWAEELDELTAEHDEIIAEFDEWVEKMDEEMKHPDVLGCTQAGAQATLLQGYFESLEALKNPENYIHNYTGSQLGKVGTIAGDILLSCWHTHFPGTRSTYWRWRKDGDKNNPSLRDCDNNEGDCPDGYTNAQGKGYQCNVNIKRAMLYLIGVAMGIPRNGTTDGTTEMGNYCAQHGCPEDCRAVMFRPNFITHGEHQGQDHSVGCAGQDGILAISANPQSKKFPAGRGGEWCKDVANQWPGIDGDYGFASITSDVANWRLWPDLWYILAEYGNAGRYAEEDNLKPAGGTASNSSHRNRIIHFDEYDRSAGPLTQAEAHAKTKNDGSSHNPLWEPEDFNDKWYGPKPEGQSLPSRIFTDHTSQCDMSSMQFTIYPHANKRREFQVIEETAGMKNLNQSITEKQAELDDCDGADPPCTAGHIERLEEELSTFEENLADLGKTYHIIYSACSTCVDWERRRGKQLELMTKKAGFHGYDKILYNGGGHRGGYFNSDSPFTSLMFHNHIIKGYCEGAQDGGGGESHNPDGNRSNTEFMLLVEGSWYMDCDCQTGTFPRRDEWRNIDGVPGGMFGGGKDNMYETPEPALMVWSGVITKEN